MRLTDFVEITRLTSESNKNAKATAKAIRNITPNALPNAMPKETEAPDGVSDAPNGVSDGCDANITIAKTRLIADKTKYTDVPGYIECARRDEIPFLKIWIFS